MYVFFIPKYTLSDQNFSIENVNSTQNFKIHCEYVKGRRIFHYMYEVIQIQNGT